MENLSSSRSQTKAGKKNERHAVIPSTKKSCRENVFHGKIRDMLLFFSQKNKRQIRDKTSQKMGKN